MTHSMAKFTIGEIVRHRLYPFRGVVIDVDPEFDNTDEWYESIPAEVRPHKDQPFYHLLAENADSYYTAYVSQQNLVADSENGRSGIPTSRSCSRASKASATRCAAKPATDPDSSGTP